MMDGIFGHENYRNEIIWQRTSSHNSAKRYGRIHDTILYYSASDKFTWNKQYTKYSAAQMSRYEMDENGEAFKGENLTAERINSNSGKFTWRGTTPGPTRGWAYTLEQLEEWWAEGRILKRKDGSPRMDGLKVLLKDMPGQPLQDIWTDIMRVSNTGAERVGYPTQKPVSLLDRIILASSKKGEVVFDPFCGCGTTIYSAEKNGRKWIGCDVAILSIQMIVDTLKGRLRLNEGRDFEVSGVPFSVEQARVLFKQDPFQFEHWLVEYIGGFPTKKTGDKGIDGRMYFETGEGLKYMVLSVKGGKLKPGDVRDLRGTMADLPDAEMAGFLSLEEPSKLMREAGAAAGRYIYNGVSYDCIQFLTVKDILEDKRDFHTPSKMVSRSTPAQAALPL